MYVKKPSEEGNYEDFFGRFEFVDNLDPMGEFQEK